MPQDLLRLAQLHQLLLLFQHTGELSIALGHEMQDQLAAIVPKHAGGRTGETQRLQKERWKRKVATSVADMCCLSITGVSSSNNSNWIFSKSPQDMQEKEFPAAQSKNAVPELLPGFSVTKCAKTFAFLLEPV